MVLKACLAEAGFSDKIRHTEDIDANWYSGTAPTCEHMTESINKALRDKGICLEASLFRMYGEGRSAGFELKDSTSGKEVFSMDIDVNRPLQPTKVYQIGEIRFRGITPYQIMADKVSVVSTGKVFRRIKDVIDLYYLSQIFDYTPGQLLETISNSGRSLGDFSSFLYDVSNLQHAYEKFHFYDGVAKPPFEDVYKSVVSFIRPLCPRKRSLDPER